MAIDTLIEVLEHLLTIAPVQEENDTKYFMPSLLDSRESSETMRPSDGAGAAATVGIKFTYPVLPHSVHEVLSVADPPSLLRRTNPPLQE